MSDSRVRVGVCVGGETSADSRPPATPDLNTRTHSRCFTASAWPIQLKHHLNMMFRLNTSTHVQHKGLLCGSEREAERVIT